MVMFLNHCVAVKSLWGTGTCWIGIRTVSLHAGAGCRCIWSQTRYHHNTPALTNFCTSFMRFLSGRHRQCFVPVSRFLTYLQGFCKIYCFSQWIHCYWFVFRVGIGTKRWTFLRSDPRTQLRSIASSMSSRSMNAVTPTPDGPQMRTSRPHRRFPWWQQNLLWLRVKILVHISFAHIS